MSTTVKHALQLLNFAQVSINYAICVICENELCIVLEKHSMWDDSC